MKRLLTHGMCWVALALLGGCATVHLDAAQQAPPQRKLGWREYLPVRFCGIPCRPEQPSSALQKGAEADPAQRWAGRELVVVGYASIAAQPGSDPAQQRLLAARASKLDAYRNLYEQVHGLTVSSSTQLDDNHIQHESVRAQTSGKLSGVEVVSIEMLGSDTYQTTLRLVPQAVGTSP